MSDMTHLDELEAEAIYIMREVAAECEKPVMLYSIGKESSVMLHLAEDGGMKRNPGRRRESSLSAIPAMPGTRKISGRRCGNCTTR